MEVRQRKRSGVGSPLRHDLSGCVTMRVHVGTPVSVHVRVHVTRVQVHLHVHGHRQETGDLSVSVTCERAREGACDTRHFTYTLTCTITGDAHRPLRVLFT